MKKRAMGAVFALIASLFFLLPAGLYAQQATTALSGSVMDPSGAILSGAIVTITRGETGQVLKTTTNGRGEYSFQQLNPGTWTITASAAGFGDQSKVGELLVSKPSIIDFHMEVQASSQTVNVTSSTTALNTSDASLGDAVDNQTIQSLPMEDRNVPDLLSLQPGVLYLGHIVDAGPGTADTDSRTGAVNGVRSDQGNVTMDGIDDNDQRTGDAFIGVLRETLDSVQEFRVTTGQANSDQGRSAGAEINLVTKSGTDKFHGGLYEYNRNTATAANNWFNKEAQISSGEPNVPGQYIRNTYGVDVGGPIIKNKLFFFGNYEASHTRENQQVARNAPFPSFQSGNLTYLSNNQPVTLSPSQIQTMDPGCASCNWGGGVDPNIVSLLQGYPQANGSALGDGYNIGSYTFSSPLPTNQNTTIARIDWYANAHNQVFVRADLQDDATDGAQQFPGQPPSYVLHDNTKGIAMGDTWTITNNLVNDFRYGFTRQGYSNSGTGCGAFVGLRFFSQPTAETCTTTVHVPVHNFIDNANWTHGNHTLSFGTDLRIITNYDNTDSASYGYAQVYNEWLSGGGTIAGTGGSFDPGAFGYAPVDSSFSNNYDIATTLLAGFVPLVSGQYNFKVSSDGQSGSTRPEGQYVPLNFRAHEFEYYVQDQWRVKPNLVVTFGIRHSILQTPYETNGQQVQPTVDTHQWFQTRVQQAAKGVTDQPDLVFAPSGQARGLQPYWNMQWGNVAPRLAIAYSPDAKTAIRAGFGMYYQHFGQGIVDSFASYGSYGLQTSIQNPDGQYTIAQVPRFTSIDGVPPLSGVNIPSTVPYPYTPPNNVNTGLALTWGVDNRIKTPYNYSMTLSVQRELPHNFSVEANYVGTLGRHLMQQLDLAEPLDLVDPLSGMDYFTAGTLLHKAAFAGQNTVAAIPYWENMFPYLAGMGMSATQNIFSNVYQPLALGGANDSYALAILDAYCQPSEGGLGCGPYSDGNGNVTTRFYQRQFSSLYAWSSIGSSSYNAFQFTTRKTSSNGLALNVSYTLSKSIDLGSDTERTSGTGSFSHIVNSFKPSLNRGPSDFDTRHLVTGSVIYKIPYGRGMAFGGSSGRIANAAFGGWMLSGIVRWSSGLPFTVYGPYSYPTNFAFLSAAVQTAPIKMHRHLVNGLPEAFADPDALNNGIATGSPLRYPYPGEAGTRNNFRGDGYFEPDGSLSKSWKVYHDQTLRFSWEVFNLTNSSRFDTNPISSFGGLNASVTSGPAFGIYSSQLVQSRKQQFSLRYDF